MTQIDFHYLNAPDKLLYTCRLLRKALGTTPSIVVTGQTEQLAALNSMLWQFSAEDFIGHCWLQQPAPANQQHQQQQQHLMQCARVWLSSSPLPCLRPHLLVNLAEQPCAGFEQYQRLIELVGASQAEHDSAQSRLLYYSERGYTITRHGLQTAT